MPITNTDEFISYTSFNSSGGIATSDTFNTWRKKTNGIINALDSISVANVDPGQLSLGAPTWNSSGDLSTYLSTGGVLGSFTASVITCGSINTGSSGNIITGNVTTNTVKSTSLTSQSLTLAEGTGLINTNGAIQANSLAIGSSNNKFTVSSAGAVVSASTIAGTSLKVGGSDTPATGAVNASSLAIGSSNSEFTVSTSGAVVGSSLHVGSGLITAGTVTATLFSGALNGNATTATTATTAASASTVPDGSITAPKLNGGQIGPAPVYGIRAFAYVLGGLSSGFHANKGFGSVSRKQMGVYFLTLSHTPTADPAFFATAVSTHNGRNVSAAVYDLVGKTFYIRTGYEDDLQACDANFSVMVVY